MDQTNQNGKQKKIVYTLLWFRCAIKFFTILIRSTHSYWIALYSMIKSKIYKQNKYLKFFSWTIERSTNTYAAPSVETLLQCTSFHGRSQGGFKHPQNIQIVDKIWTPPARASFH